MIIYFSVLSAIMGFTIYTRKHMVPMEDETQGITRIFYKAGYSIVDYIMKSKFMKSKFMLILCPNKVRRSLRLIHPLKKGNEAWKVYLANKISLVFLILALGSIFAIAMEMNSQSSGTLLDGKYIRKNGYLGTPKEETLQASVEGILDEAEVKVTIERQKYNREEIEEIFTLIIEELDIIILGNNESLDAVRNDLNLIDSYPNYPVTIEWSMDPYVGIDTNGHLIEEDIGELGTLIRLDAELSYEEYMRTYSTYVKLLPHIKSPEEIERNKILKAISEVNEGKDEEENFELPTEVEGKKIVWSKEEQKNAFTIFLLFLVCSVLIYIGKDYDLQKQVKNRKMQLILDYPDIVSKLHILLGAGMTMHGAFTKIAFDYEKKKAESKNFKEIRYAYEEMLIVSYEMQSGVSEVKCYENFGKRCKENLYIKLGVLLSQNLKKGSQNVSVLLDEEMRNTLEVRKNLAKKLGEEAGTKLLLPMILMLAVVLIILIFPAFLSFQM